MAFLRETGGGWVTDPQEVLALMESLHKLKWQMETHGGKKILSYDTTEHPPLDQEALRREYCAGLAQEIAMSRESKWHFDVTDVSRAKECVYFMQSLAGGYDRYIKIGSTNRLEERVHEVEHDHLQYDFEVIAFVNTEHYRDLEQFYKYQFAQHIVFGEFLKREPVEWYLNYMRSLMRTRELGGTAV